MKSWMLIVGILFLGSFLLPFHGVSGSNDALYSNDPQRGDTLEYELIIFDPHFESWYHQVQKPLSFYSQQYLESWNEQLVNQWNSQIPADRRAACLVDSYIDYQPDLDYGLELNHRLFYFFRYMHERCEIFFSVPGRW